MILRGDVCVKPTPSPVRKGFGREKTVVPIPLGISIPLYAVSDMVNSMCLTTCHRCSYVLQSDRISISIIFTAASN